MLDRKGNTGPKISQFENKLANLLPKFLSKFAENQFYFIIFKIIKIMQGVHKVETNPERIFIFQFTYSRPLHFSYQMCVG
jgi:hypothetical protein